MSKSLLLIVDIQKNFINENTRFLLDKINNLLNINKFDVVAFTKFINDENSPFYKILNWQGCMTES